MQRKRRNKMREGKGKNGWRRLEKVRTTLRGIVSLSLLS
jgi:hypothetical protein